MKSFIITEQQIVDCFKLGEANDPAGLLKLTATLPEHIPVTLEAEPGAPKDWSGHKHYNDCNHCHYLEDLIDPEVCGTCRKDNSHWQPRTP